MLTTTTPAGTPINRQKGMTTKRSPALPLFTALCAVTLGASCSDAGAPQTDAYNEPAATIVESYPQDLDRLFPIVSVVEDLVNISPDDSADNMGLVNAYLRRQD